MANATEIFVALVGEGVDVWRPVQATPEGEHVYRIISPNPDPADERWEFAPGDLVRCERRVFSDGTGGLAACSKASGDAQPIVGRERRERVS